MRAIACCLIVFSLSSAATATDRFFKNITVHSPSGRFRVDATSPHNDGNVHRSFQSHFTYKCVDTSSGDLIWSRKQAMGKPLRLGEDSRIEIDNPKEASPIFIYVSDSGWTVIRTAWDDLIVVAPNGADVGKIDLLENGLTKVENKKFVHHTTAGPSWASLSAWYFLRTSTDEYFVIRPWWGRRIFLDVRKGQLTKADQATLRNAAKEQEARLVLSTLKSKAEPRHGELSKYEAAYLAGVLQLKKAIPFLRSLEQSKYSGSCTLGGLSRGEELNNEVDPHTYSTFSLRQVAQLSLRRLGEKPKPLPCHTFELKHGSKSAPFIPTPQKHPRHHNVQSIKVGMDAKQVLTLIGSPDFVGWGTWSYDMDAAKPFSVTLTFDARRVTRIKHDGPLWKSGFSRDEGIAY